MKKQQRYTPEFRAEAVKLVFDCGLSLETWRSRTLGCTRNCLRRAWSVTTDLAARPLVTLS